MFIWNYITKQTSKISGFNRIGDVANSKFPLLTFAKGQLRLRFTVLFYPQKLAKVFLRVKLSDCADAVAFIQWTAGGIGINSICYWMCYTCDSCKLCKNELVMIWYYHYNHDLWVLLTSFIICSLCKEYDCHRCSPTTVCMISSCAVTSTCILLDAPSKLTHKPTVLSLINTPGVLHFSKGVWHYICWLMYGQTLCTSL